MAKIFDKDNVALMSFGKAMSRMAAQPLDESEIWYDLAELTEYAKNGETAYVGMKVTYVDETNSKVYQYSIQTDGTLKEIGVAPLGDGKSITVSAEGVVSILGVENADSLTLPRMKEDKSGLEWVPISAIVEGDGNDNTTYTFTPLTKGEGENAETYGFTVKTFFNGTEVEGGEFEFAFDVYTKSETDAAIKVVADKVGVPAEGDDSTDTLYERIAAEVLRATNAESALSDRIGIAKDGETAATGVYAYVDGVVNALVNGVDPDKIDSLNELIAWVEAHPDIVSGLDERLDAVEGILDGIGGEGEKATVKAYVDDAFTAHETAADDKYATKQEITDAGYAVAADVERDYAKKATTLAGYGITDAYTKTEIDNKIGTPGVPAQGKEGEEGYVAPVDGTGVFANAYSKAEVNALLDEVSGGSSETAASVKRQLDEYKTSNNERVAAIEAQVGKDVNGEEPATGLFLEVDEARKVADEAKTASTKNANDIAALQGQLGTTNTNVSGLTTRLAALEAEVGEVAESRIDALEGVTAQHTIDIGANTTAITKINTETIPALQGVVNTKAAQADVDAINTKIGTVEEGKTVVDMINAVAGTIDFTPYAKKDEVAATYATIVALEGIYKAGEGEAGATGILAEEIARAKAAEKDLDDAIKLLTDGAGTDEIDSVKELIDYVNDHGATVEGINDRLDGHDALLTDIGGEGQPATVIAAIEAAAYVLPGATAATLGGIKSAADVDGKTAVNKVYVDATTNIAEVKAFSTDNLVQGNMTLVLNGGDAQVSSN